MAWLHPKQGKGGRTADQAGPRKGKKVRGGKTGSASPGLGLWYSMWRRLESEEGVSSRGEEYINREHTYRMRRIWSKFYKYIHIYQSDTLYPLSTVLHYCWPPPSGRLDKLSQSTIQLPSCLFCSCGVIDQIVQILRRGQSLEPNDVRVHHLIASVPNQVRRYLTGCRCHSLSNGPGWAPVWHKRQYT